MSTEQTLDHVVITGSSGWLGSELIRGLTEGLSQSKYYSNPSPNLQITAMDLPGKESFKHSNVQPSFGDICNPEDCKKAVANKPGLTLFHLAGVIHPKKVAEFYKTNRDGTKNILEAAATQKPRRIVVVSSNSPFGCNPHNDHVFDEWSSYNPYMGYGQSKMQMEYAVKEFRRTTGINAILIRAPWFYGPNPPDRQREFFSMIRKGRFPILGKGENRRSMVYLENLIQGLIHASLADVHQQDYWVADERPYPMMEIIKTVGYALEQEFGIKVKKKQATPPLDYRPNRSSDRLLSSEVGHLSSKDPCPVGNEQEHCLLHR